MSEDEIKNLKSELDNRQNQNIELERKLGGLESAREALLDAQKHITDLESQTSELQHSATRLQESDEKVKTLQSTISQHEAKLRSLEDVHTIHQETQRELQDVKGQLDDHLHTASRLKERDEMVLMLQGVIKELEDKALETEAAFTAFRQFTGDTDSLSKQIDELERNRIILQKEAGEKESQLQKDLEEKSSQAAHAEGELRFLEGEVARLSTEVAMLQAEIDESHGASKQRLAEVRRQAAEALQAEAGRPQAAMDVNLLIELEDLSKKNQQLLTELRRLKEERQMEVQSRATNDENDGGNAGRSSTREQALRQRCEELQKELNEMLYDFETVTKTSIEFENERTKLEDLIDSLRQKVETLETNLADEKVRWLGMGSTNGLHARSPSVGVNGLMTPGASAGFGPGGENTSTTVLKSEFKKMMRDMRGEQMKLLRVSGLQPHKQKVSWLCVKTNM